MIKWFWSKYGLVDHHFGPGLGRGSREVIITVIGGEKQFVQDKQVLVAWWVVYPEEALPFPSLGQFLLCLLKVVINKSSFVDSKVAARE
jgi:hypothetical protein